eukprot:725727-Rhodomonas_salina.1
MGSASETARFCTIIAVCMMLYQAASAKSRTRAGPPPFSLALPPFMDALLLFIGTITPFLEAKPQLMDAVQSFMEA